MELILRYVIGFLVSQVFLNLDLCLNLLMTSVAVKDFSMIVASTLTWERRRSGRPISENSRPPTKSTFSRRMRSPISAGYQSSTVRTSSWETLNWFPLIWTTAKSLSVSGKVVITSSTWARIKDSAEEEEEEEASTTEKSFSDDTIESWALERFWAREKCLTIWNCPWASEAFGQNGERRRDGGKVWFEWSVREKAVNVSDCLKMLELSKFLISERDAHLRAIGLF